MVLEKTLESPLDCKEIQPVHSEGDQPWDFFGRYDAEAETAVLWPPHAKSWLTGKDSDAGRDWGQEEKGMTEDEMAGWHHGLDGRESEWTPGAGDGQGGLVWCDSWGRKELDVTEWLKWTEMNWTELNWSKKIEDRALYVRGHYMSTHKKSLKGHKVSVLLRTDTVPVQCISYIKNCPKTSGSKQHTLFHDFCGSETWEKLGWILCFRVFHKVAIKVLPVISSEGSVGGRPGSKPFPQVVGRIQFLKGCWYKKAVVHIHNGVLLSR